MKASERIREIAEERMAAGNSFAEDDPESVAADIHWASSYLMEALAILAEMIEGRDAPGDALKENNIITLLGKTLNDGIETFKESASGIYGGEWWVNNALDALKALKEV